MILKSSHPRAPARRGVAAACADWLDQNTALIVMLLLIIGGIFLVAIFTS